MASNRESFCADAFDQFLEVQLQLHNRTWIDRSSKQQDPPDYILTVNGDDFAVEITTTRVLRDVSIGAGQIGEETYEHSHTNFIDELDSTARQSGILHGTYVVAFRKPMADSDFRRVRKNVREKLLDYIDNTKRRVTAPARSIRYQDRYVCSVEKLGTGNDLVAESFTDVAWPESTEVKSRTCKILQTAVTEKKESFLTKSQVEKSVLNLPRILLLLNTYGFADRSLYSDCVTSIRHLNFFHSIFIVQLDGTGYVLHSQEPSWL